MVAPAPKSRLFLHYKERTLVIIRATSLPSHIFDVTDSHTIPRVCTTSRNAAFSLRPTTWHRTGSYRERRCFVTRSRFLLACGTSEAVASVPDPSTRRHRPSSQRRECQQGALPMRGKHIERARQRCRRRSVFASPHSPPKRWRLKGSSSCEGAFASGQNDALRLSTSNCWNAANC